MYSPFFVGLSDTRPLLGACYHSFSGYVVGLNHREIGWKPRVWVLSPRDSFLFILFLLLVKCSFLDFPLWHFSCHVSMHHVTTVNRPSQKFWWMGYHFVWWGRTFGNKYYTCVNVIVCWRWTLTNEIFLWTCHHVMTVYLLVTKKFCGCVITWWQCTFQTKYSCEPVITWW